MHSTILSIHFILIIFYVTAPLLVKLYSESEYFNRIKLIKEAKYVLNAKPKVNSIAIKEMRQEVKKILKDKT